MAGVKHTLCWDCANACGGCSWSNHWDHLPVDGWKAVETRVRMNNDDYEVSYIVLECPRFERDGVDGGTARPWKRENPWTRTALRREHG